MRLTRRLAFAALLVLFPLLSGCQIVIGVLQMVQGKPEVPAHFHQKTGRRLEEKNKRVLVLSFADSPALSEHPSLPVETVQLVSSKLRVKGITTVDSQVATRFMESGETFDFSTDYAPIGEKYEADFVVVIGYENFSTRQENSTGLYRGTARARIQVFELTGQEGDKVARRLYSKGHDSRYPAHTPLETDSMNPDLFLHKFMDTLTEELARHFYDHPPGVDI
ncbi:MAG: hypothetical protein ACKO3P_00265 [Planctomycetaceae bacterium]